MVVGLALGLRVVVGADAWGRQVCTLVCSKAMQARPAQLVQPTPTCCMKAPGGNPAKG